MSEDKYSVYAHINKQNGKMYIGCTGKFPPSLRWGKNGSGYNNGQEKFQKAIEKYGWDSFEHVVLEFGLSQEDALYLEETLIAKYDTVENGYNAAYGGRLNRLSKESKEKLRKQRFGKDNPYYKESRKHKYSYIKHENANRIEIEKILNYTFKPGETSTDGRKSIEFRDRQREMKLGKNNPNYGKRTWQYGKKLSEETKQKLRDSFTEERKERIRKQKTGKNNPQAKKVLCITTNKEYCTIVDAAKNTGVSEKSISQCCNGYIKRVKGLEFAFSKGSDA